MCVSGEGFTPARRKKKPPGVMADRLFSTTLVWLPSVKTNATRTDHQCPTLATSNTYCWRELARRMCRRRDPKKREPVLSFMRQSVPFCHHHSSRESRFQWTALPSGTLNPRSKLETSRKVNWPRSMALGLGLWLGQMIGTLVLAAMLHRNNAPVSVLSAELHARIPYFLSLGLPVSVLFGLWLSYRMSHSVGGDHKVGHHGTASERR